MSNPRNRRAVDTMRSLALEEEALDLAKTGASIREIARVQRVHPSTAHDRVRRGLDRLAPIQQAEEYRRLAVDQLDGVIAGNLAVLNRAAEAANYDLYLRAAQTYARLSERRARFLGLDAPVKVDATITDKITSEIESLVEALAGNDTDVPSE